MRVMARRNEAVAHVGGVVRCARLMIVICQAFMVVDTHK